MISEQDMNILDAAMNTLDDDDSTEYLIQFLIDNLEELSNNPKTRNNAHSIVMEYLFEKND